MAVRQRAAKRTGAIEDEGSALTESTIKETFQKLLKKGKSKDEIFEALKKQTVDLVLTAHPTQSIRRSLLQKHARCVPGIMYPEAHQTQASFMTAGGKVSMVEFIPSALACPCQSACLESLPEAGGRQEGCSRDTELGLPCWGGTCGGIFFCSQDPHHPVPDSLPEADRRQEGRAGRGPKARGNGPAGRVGFIAQYVQ